MVTMRRLRPNCLLRYERSFVIVARGSHGERNRGGTMAPPNSRRLLTAVAATFTALTLVAGCGGSDVQEAASATDGAVTQAGTTSLDGAATGTDATAAVPGAAP